MSNKVFFAKTDLENRLNRGDFVVAYDEEELELLEFKKLATLLELSDNSFYHVGFKMGETLTSIKHLKPEAKVGGCEISDLYESYSNKILHNGKLGIKFEVRNFEEESADEQYEVVFSDGVLTNYNLDVQKKIVTNMLKSSSKYVVLNEKVCNNLIGYVKYLGHTVESNDEVTIIVKGIKKVENAKPRTTEEE